MVLANPNHHANVTSEDDRVLCRCSFGIGFLKLDGQTAPLRSA